MIGWDPSESVTNCRECGICIEGWLDKCEDCTEKEFSEYENEGAGNNE